MAQSSAMNSPRLAAQDAGEDVKAEVEVQIKAEVLECAVCGARSPDCVDMYCERTPSGAPLHHFLAKYSPHELALADTGCKQVCRACFDLVSVLERAEMEYVKLKEAFEAIISKNPLFDVSVCAQPVPLALPAPLALPDVKHELPAPAASDSEDEPLARRKSKSTKLKKKKKLTTGKAKRKKSGDSNSSSWECEECGVKGDSGGELAFTAHKLSVHSHVPQVKLEDGSQSPFNNGIEDSLELSFRDYEDDNDSTYNPEEVNGEDKKKTRRRQGEKKPPKVMHRCDQCNARYSSLVRLESHKQKHDGSKPPYICEVCGAHYKHKRACDIHIAMHKGISDWKCEECNKLFPSKNALQRHNNIHTGKLNYQCDLCGKSFIHTSSFKMHKLSHTGVKPHACDVCGLGLMTRSHLKRHKRIHSGEKRHECTACGKRFSERYNLAAHLKSHEAGAPPHPPDPPERRRHFFRCNFCVERFERRYMLERHMSAAHGRTLERPPPTPRNTMSKLLKQRAQRPPAPAPAPAPAASPPHAAAKEEPLAATAVPTSKLLAQLTSSSSIITSGSWSGAYAAEFGLRHDYPH